MFNTSSVSYKKTGSSLTHTVLFRRVFFIDRFTGETKQTSTEPTRPRSFCKTKLPLDITCCCKFCVNSAVNVVAFFDKINRGQPLRDINFLKLFENASPMYQVLNVTTRIVAHVHPLVYHCTHSSYITVLCNQYHTECFYLIFYRFLLLSYITKWRSLKQ